MERLGACGGGRPGRPRGPKRVVLSNRLRIGNCLSQTVTYWCADLRRGIFSGVAGLRVSLSLCHGSAWLTRRSPGDAGGASLHQPVTLQTLRKSERLRPPTHTPTQVSAGSKGATLRTPERLRSPTPEAGADCEFVGGTERPNSNPKSDFCRGTGTDCEFV